MFGLLFVARREFWGAAYSKTLRPLFRCLFGRGVISLWLLCVLYRVAEYMFSELYVPLGSVWKPAFPLTWRLILLSLFMVPTIAFIQLLWLSLHHPGVASLCWRRTSSSRSSSSQRYTMLPRSESNTLEEGVLYRAGDDDNCDMADSEGNTGSWRFHTSSQPFPFSRFFLWLAILFTSLWLALCYQHPGDLRYRSLIETANTHPKREGYANKGIVPCRGGVAIAFTQRFAEKIFIAAMFFNNERVIPYWSNSLIQAIHYLGEDNVFVSILESGSRDRSRKLLRQLDDRLDAMRVARRILTEDTAITKPEDMGGSDRIDFLSALRNRALEPLVEMGGYDKVMFSNDIYIEPESIVELLKTADGEYDMACGMDFGHYG